MNVQNACREVVSEVDGSLGCIVIDMQTGLTVASECRQGAALNEAMIGLVAVISTNMFSGRMIRRFEELLDRPDSPATGFVREVQMTTAQTNQFMSAIPGWRGGLLVLITDKSVSLGLGWMAVHRIVDRLSASPAASPPAADALPPHPAPEPRAPHAEPFWEPSPTPSAPIPQAPFAPPLHGQPSALPSSPVMVEDRPRQAPDARDASYRFDRPLDDRAPPAAPLGNAPAAPLEDPAPTGPTAPRVVPPLTAEELPVREQTPEEPGAQAQAAKALAAEVLVATTREAEMEETPPAAAAKKPSVKKAPAGARMNMFASRKKKRGAK